MMRSARLSSRLGAALAFHPPPTQLHLRSTLLPLLRSFSTRLPDTFDPIDDRDDSLIPPSERGLSQSEFDALPAPQRASIRRHELDLILAEDAVASRRPSSSPLPSDDDADDIDEGDFNAPDLLTLSQRSSPLHPPPGIDPSTVPTTSYTSAVPVWHQLQTGNPEFIPALPGSDVSRPTSVRYPFIPVITTPRELTQASFLHRALQYDRLRSAKHFLALERKRRQLQYQREYRDLSAFTDGLLGRVPKAREELEGARPVVKNLPTNVSKEHLQRTHPHTLPTSTALIGEVLRFMEAELRMVGVRSTLEKERLMSATLRHMAWVYKRMMKDKAKGYYRILPTTAPFDIKVAGAVRGPPPAVHRVSSALRQGRLHSAQ